MQLEFKRVSLWFGLAMLFPAASVRGYDCVERYCTKMQSCAEAHHHFTVCGETQRDADDDGIPCENACGQTPEEYRQRRGGGSSGSVAPPEPSANADREPREPAPDINEQALQPPAASPADLRCAVKRKCGEMSSCEEARFYLSSCRVRSLDRDGDGVPCESLCGG